MPAVPALFRSPEGAAAVLGAAAAAAGGLLWRSSSRRLGALLDRGAQPSAVEHLLRSDRGYREVAALLDGGGEAAAGSDSESAGVLDSGDEGGGEALAPPARRCDDIVTLCSSVSKLTEAQGQKLRVVLAALERADAARFTFQKMRSQPVSPKLPHHLELLSEIAQSVLGEDPAIPSLLWLRAGFQSNDPCRDFRAGGALALRCLASFCRAHTDVARAAAAAHTPAKEGVWYLLAVESIGVTCDLLDWFDATRGAPEKQSLSAYWHLSDPWTQGHLQEFQRLHDLMMLEGWRRWQRDQPHAQVAGRWRARWARPENFAAIFGPPPPLLYGPAAAPLPRQPSVSGPSRPRRRAASPGEAAV
eukprot:TRINITY_DN3181_c0_g1_i1.p1 TRINITY_DN3181_c0_g1~~TRINITY_DN3181_c0_g1_i1.p1  ORF type:complete len:386 (+),score=93.83 TRINITY_DN3181_c0_g1_i1:80-1159(+)